MKSILQPSHRSTKNCRILRNRVTNAATLLRQALLSSRFPNVASLLRSCSLPTLDSSQVSLKRKKKIQSRAIGTPRFTRSNVARDFSFQYVRNNRWPVLLSHVIALSPVTFPCYRWFFRPARGFHSALPPRLTSRTCKPILIELNTHARETSHAYGNEGRA